MDLGSLSSAVERIRTLGAVRRGVTILNLANTARGAITTLLFATSAIGGAATVQHVANQQPDTEARSARAAVSRPPFGIATPSSAPTRSPLPPGALRADAEARVRGALEQDAAALADLRRVSALSPAGFDQVVAEANVRLQQRADLALAQIAELTGAAAPSPGVGARPSPSFSPLALSSLVQVAVADLAGIVNQTTRAVTAPPSAAPAPVSPPAPPAPRTPPGSPARTPVASPSPSASPRR